MLPMFCINIPGYSKTTILLWFITNSTNAVQIVIEFKNNYIVMVYPVRLLNKGYIVRIQKQLYCYGLSQFK